MMLTEIVQQVICGYGEDALYGPYWIVRNSWVISRLLTIFSALIFIQLRRATFGANKDILGLREDETHAE